MAMWIIEFDKMEKERENVKPTDAGNDLGVHGMDEEEEDYGDDEGIFIDLEHGNNINKNGRIEQF